MFTLRCPYCDSLGSFQPVYEQPGLPAARRYLLNPTLGESRFRLVVARCPSANCTLVVAMLTFDVDVLEHWPTKVGGKSFPDVPQHIASAADEAHKCMSIGAHRGAIALARAVVEATAKHQGVTTGNLMAKIDALAEQGVISAAMKEAAHEIRFAGNEVAHGDLADEPISAEDANEVLALMDAILLRVYQEPAQVAQVRARREARKAGVPAPGEPSITSGP